MEVNTSISYEEDEDLILESSPLNHYLREIGRTDVGTFSFKEERGLSEAEYVTKEECIRHPTCDLHYKASYISLATSYLISLSTTFCTACASPLRYGQGIRGSCLKEGCIRAAEIVLASNIFNVSDESLLFKEYYTALLKARNEKSKRQWLSWKFTYQFSHICIVFSAVMIALIYNYGSFLAIQINTIYTLLQITLPAVALVWIPFLVFGFLAIKDRLSIVRFRTSLNKTLQLLHQYNCFLDKSILLIKEVEIISMGFAYPHPRHSRFLVNMASSSGREQYCYSLRKHVRETTQESIKELVSYHNNLLSALPLGKFCKDSTLDSLSVTSSESLQEISQAILTQEDDQNGVCLTSLKTCVNVFRFTCLEVLKLFVVALSITLSSSNQAEMSEGDPRELSRFFTGEVLHNCSKIVTLLSESFAPRVESCQRMLSFTDKYPFGYIREKEMSVDNNRSAIPNSKPLSLIRGAELHFMSILSDLKHLRALVTDDTAELRSATDNSRESFVASCERNLSAGSICIENLRDTLVRPLHQLQDDASSVALGSNESVNPSEVDLKATSQSASNVEQPLEIEGDRLYEGLSEPHASNEDGSLNMDFFSDGTKEQAKTTKHLLTELRSILSHKDSPIGLVSLDKIKELKDLHAVTTDYDYEEKPALPMNSSESIDEVLGASDSRYPCSTHSLEAGEKDEDTVDVRDRSDDGASYPMSSLSLPESELPFPLGVNLDDHTEKPPLNPFALTFQKSFSQSILDRSKRLGLTVETFGETDSSDDSVDDDDSRE